MQAETHGDWYGDDKATFGDRLTAAREAAGLSVRGLANALGVQPRTIGQWENDMSEPRANRLQMLSGVLGVSLVWLVTGRGDGVPPPGEAEAARRVVPARALLSEIGAVRSELGTLSHRLGQLERQLRQSLTAP